jgi:crotonobetaine/carnitine-CoA ligase
VPSSDSPAAAAPAAERTVVALLQHQAQELGERPFLKVGGTSWTFAGMADTAACRAGSLRAAGIEPGDRVATILRNGPELVELFFACAWAGAVLVPLNVASKGEQLAHMLRNAAPRVLVVDGELVAHLDVPGGLPAELERLWLVGASAAGGAGAHELVPLPHPSGAVAPLVGAPGDPVAVLYTSGTTGPSKGVVCPNGQFWWWGVNTAAALGIGPADVLYNCLPLFHTNALNTILQGLMHGARVVIGDRFSASGFWQTLAANDATVTYILGAMATILAEREPTPLDRGHRVRVALSPATAPALWPVFAERFGISLVEGHGMTETNLAIGPRDGEQRPGWMGRTMPGFEARIVDEHDDEVPHGTAGELVLRADEAWAFASGYRGMPEATVSSWRNLWFHSGDRAVRDVDGWFRFLDRSKDAIRRRGENISAWEVEQALGAHPGVADVAAVPVPSELGEDDVMVFLVPSTGTPEPADLIHFAAQRLPYYAVPRYVEFVDELPLTANGKVQKFALRARGVSATTWDRVAAGVEVERP